MRLNESGHAQVQPLPMIHWRLIAAFLLSQALLSSCVYVPPYYDDPYYADPYSPRAWPQPTPPYPPRDAYFGGYGYQPYPRGRRSEWRRHPEAHNYRPTPEAYGSTGTAKEDSPIPPAKVEPPAPAASSPPKVDTKDVQTATPGSKPGRVKSPYPPHTELDVTGMKPGSLARDPSTGRVFRIP